MIVTGLTTDLLKRERFRRNLIKRGYEQIGERGGKLWELYRGCRIGHRIVAVEIDPDGIRLWVKIEPEAKDGAA